MRIKGKWKAALGWLLLWGASHLAGRVLAQGTDSSLMLTLPRLPKADETIYLQLTAGVLPKGARVIVLTSEGEIVGTVAPYGLRPGTAAGTYSMVVPGGAVKDGKVSLRVEVEEHETGTRRKTKGGEIQAVKVVLAPKPKPVPVE